MVFTPQPIARAPMLVSDGDEIDGIFPHTIDDVIRKPWNNTFSKSVLEMSAGFGISQNAFRRLLYRI
jgi:hypothetical protein